MVLRELTGTTLRNYRVLERIGSGGMGDVYRAQDEGLARDVAVKLLPDGVARNPEWVGRFRREARVLASLNHPAIAQIYGFEVIDGVHFLVMELVPGEDLDQRIARGPVPLVEALDIAGQIAEALDEAHQKRIIHRDLKPANVKLAPNGRVKVLDFGLAKVLAGESASRESGEDSTLPAERTQIGTVLGTPSYMSPEQTKGHEVDERTDIWALGCCLFEALTGRSAFPGESYAEIVAAVLAKEPPWDLLPRDTPPPIRRLLAACLTKDPGERLWSAGDLGDAVRRAKETAARVGSTAVSALPQLHQITYSDSIEESPAWSPDGKELVHTRQVGAVRRLFRHRLESGESFPLTRGPHDDFLPVWHPDGSAVLFVRSRAPGRKLEPGDVFGNYAGEPGGDVWRLDLKSGEETRLVEDAYNPAMSPDGSRIAVDAAWAGPHRIWTVDAHGRNPRQITTDISEAVIHVRPRWSPDGTKLVFQSIERTQFDIRSVDTATGGMAWITRDLVIDVHPTWAPGGDAVYFTSYRSGGMNIWKVEVDASGAPAGPLHQVTAGPGQDVDVTLSPDGRRMAFAILRQNADLWRLPVSPADGEPTGAPEVVVASTREDSRGAWSPDDSMIAFNSNRGGEMNLWLRHAADGSLTQLTRGPGGDYQPNWSPDGSRLAFFSSRGGNPGIWKVAAVGGEPVGLSPPERVEVNPFFSPDGTRIAYHSDRDGRLELWVMDGDGRNPTKLTTGGVMGHFVRWSRDGKWIYFRAGTGDLGVQRVPSAGGASEPLPGVKGGSHLSLAPDENHIADVLFHKELWISPISGGEARKVFEFDQPDGRIDYPVWSNDGKWILFDRFQPHGGDIWIMDDPAR